MGGANVRSGDGPTSAGYGGGVTDPTFTPRRRAIMRGAAWTAPVITTAVAAPAFAASPCKTTLCPDLSFGTVTVKESTNGGNGWSYAPTTGGWSRDRTANPVGFMPAVAAGSDPVGGKGTWFAATNEPTTNARVLTLSQSGQPALNSGCSYTLNFGVVTYTDAGTPLILRAFAGATQIAQYTTSGASNAYVDQGIQSFVLPVGTAGLVTFRFVFGNAGAHEDIKLYSPSVTCETP